jgi:GTP-binding protein
MEFIRWFGENALPFVLIFTKADKLSKTKLSQNLKSYQKVLQSEWEELPLSLVSSAKSGLGKEQVLGLIRDLLAQG